MDVKITKSDIIWSYFAQFFNIGAGFITLPLILHMLSTEEIAMNYIMLTIGSMVALIDFGFAPQFGRNVTYVFSGAKKLQKEGLICDSNEEIDFHLLKCLIDVAKIVYRLMSLVVLFIMATIGTFYIYKVTNGFSNVDNSLLIWIVYSLSTYFNIYFFYYSSLLTGRGLIKESKKSMLFSKVSYIILTYVLLLCGLGLLGVCIANLLSPFINRWLSYRYFYDDEIKKGLSLQKTNYNERKELFTIIWYNAKKLGINFIGAYAILKFSLFIAGLYLSAYEISSYGLMTQLVHIIAAISTTFITAFIPRITSLRVNRDNDHMVRSFAMSMDIYYIIYIVGSLSLLLFGSYALSLIGSNATLPSLKILVPFIIITLLENNHGQFATFITTGNDVPFVKAAIASGFLICLGDILVLQFTELGLFGIVAVQGLVQLAYNNWYWPRWVLKRLNISYPRFVLLGINEIHNISLRTIKKCNT